MVTKTKYGQRIGGVFFSAGSVVTVLSVDDARVQAIWPGIAAEPTSTLVAVLFPGRVTPTVVSDKELLFSND